MMKTCGLHYPPETAETGSDLKAQSDVYLIKEVKNGNGDAFRILAERYNYIISCNVSKLYSSYSSAKFASAIPDKEDLFQECRIVLYKAAKYYDLKKEKEVKFSTYSNICVKNYLISLCRKYGRTGKYCGYDFIPLDELRENESGIYDRYFAFSDFPSFIETIKTIETPGTASFFGNLTMLEKKVLIMYIDDKSYKYMARILNKSVKSIDNAICRIKSKLKPYAEYFVSEY